jgi:CubicO group peptidase (beta-lactamase class C family)
MTPTRPVPALRCWALAVLALLLVVPGVVAAPPDAQLDRYLASALARTGLPGMAVVVTHGAQIVYRKGFGSAGPGRPVTPGTQFRLASLSKSFTALAVLQLAEAGRVGLDEPVRAYLPEFTTADPGASRRITVRHLLNHTSGMADAGFPAAAQYRPESLPQRVRSLRQARLAGEPGREFHYFDPNYQLLARIVEVVIGMRFETYLRERVFLPLGMGHTVATETAADTEATRLAPQLARGHVLVFSVPVARVERDGLLTGSGGVISTAEDLAGWLILHSTGRGPSGQALLTPAGMALLHTPPPGVSGGYGMGWQVVTPAQGPSRLEHHGVLPSFSADQVVLPGTGYAFAVLYNGNSALADTAAVASGLAALLTGATPPGVRSTRLVAAVLGGLTGLTAAVRVRGLLRLRGWAQRRRGRPWWAALPGFGWLLLPVALLAAMPALLLVSIGRSFTFWQLCLAMPDVMIFLAVLAVTGVLLAVGRVTVLLRSG